MSSSFEREASSDIVWGQRAMLQARQPNLLGTRHDGVEAFGVTRCGVTAYFRSILGARTGQVKTAIAGWATAESPLRAAVLTTTG